LKIKEQRIKEEPVCKILKILALYFLGENKNNHEENSGNF